MGKVSRKAKMGFLGRRRDRVERDPTNENFSSCMEMQESCLCELPCVQMCAVTCFDSDRLARVV